MERNNHRHQTLTLSGWFSHFAQATAAWAGHSTAHGAAAPVRRSTPARKA